MSNAAVRLIDRHVEGSLGHKPAFDFNEKKTSAEGSLGGKGLSVGKEGFSGKSSSKFTNPAS